MNERMNKKEREKKEGRKEKNGGNPAKGSRKGPPLPKSGNDFTGSASHFRLVLHQNEAIPMCLRKKVKVSPLLVFKHNFCCSFFEFFGSHLTRWAP